MLTPIEKIRIKQWDERKSDHDDDLMSLGAVRMLLDAKEAEWKEQVWTAIDKKQEEAIAMQNEDFLGAYDSFKESFMNGLEEAKDILNLL